MISFRNRHRAGAFTLVEMLVVIAIIGILAALLLPALSQGAARAKRIDCVHNLQEIGLSFHAFMHDHSGKFPMELPAAQDGTLEFVTAGYAIPGDFYFSYRHLQALSNEVIATKVLWCPTDLQRTVATNFTVLSNNNVSYFVGVNASYDRPMSVLAGDRNISSSMDGSRTIQHTVITNDIRWTSEMHRNKGNILFSDGHVEQRNKERFDETLLARGDFFLPTMTAAQMAYSPPPPSSPAPAPPSPSGGSPGNQSPSGSGGGNANNQPSAPPPMPSGGMAGSRPPSASTTKIEVAANTKATNAVKTTNSSAVAKAKPPPTVVTLPQKPDPWDGGSNRLKEGNDWSWLIYLLLFLLAMVILIFILRRFAKRRSKKGRRKYSAKDSPYYQP